MDGFQEDLKRHYEVGFNDGIYHTTDFMKSVAQDLRSVAGEEGEKDASLLEDIADVLLEDLKKEHND